MDRIDIAKKSSFISLTSQILTSIFAFILRKIIIDNIGINYLGLHATLQQLIGTLSLAELGISTAVTFRLYKPIVEKKYTEINEIITIFRTFYNCIALIIFFLGVLFIPLVHNFIRNIDISQNEIILFWIILTITSSSSYLLSYNAILLNADNKQYKCVLVNSLISILTSLVSIFVIKFLKNYFFYLGLLLIQSILSQIIIFYIRKKEYSWLKITRFNKNLFKDILADLKNILISRFTAYIFNSTDNLVISSFIGTSTVAVVGNYFLVISTIKTLFYSIMSPIQLLIGNYFVTAGKKEKKDLFIIFSFINFILICIFIIPSTLLMNDFIGIFFGNEFILSNEILFLLIFDTYICLIQCASGILCDSSGLFEQQRSFYMIASIVNITVSIFCVKLIGISGVILGTVLGNLICWYKRVSCFLIYVIDDLKYIAKYILENILYGLIFLLILCITSFSINKIFNEVNIMNFIFKGFVTVFFICIQIGVIFFNTNRFKALINLVLSKSNR